MFERLTERARKVMALANQEAQRFNHAYISTEHILLGLVKEGSGVGANVLKTLDIDLRKVRRDTERLIKSAPDAVAMGKLPQTPRAKKVIEYAIEEARRFDHEYMGTEHLLLGLLREQEGMAGVILANLGVTVERAREIVVEIVGPGGAKRLARESTTRIPSQRTLTGNRWVSTLLAISFTVLFIFASYAAVRTGTAFRMSYLALHMFFAGMACSFWLDVVALHRWGLHGARPRWFFVLNLLAGTMSLIGLVVGLIFWFRSNFA